MTGVTPAWGLPYPEADTLITDSAAIVQELAEKIDAALSAVTASDEYTVPGTLIANMTTSGTFTPPAGVTLVHVVVIGGGGAGRSNTGSGGDAGSMPGGSGGEVRVYRGVPVTGDVPVTIGASLTASSFGALTANPGRTSPFDKSMARAWTASGLSDSGYADGNPATDRKGRDGVLVNGTRYAGGGGGGFYRRNSNEYNGSGEGGAGGGGRGAYYNYGGGGPMYAARSGADNTGSGGGGGAQYGGGLDTRPGGLGGSGRVMIYTEQTLLATLDLPPATVPKIVAALDADGHMTGAYAVDAGARELLAHLERVIDYPTEPVDTGRTEIALVDPENPTGPTAVVPVLAWPEAGWKYTNNKWEEPSDQTTA